MAGSPETNPYRPPGASADDAEVDGRRVPLGFVNQAVLVLILTGLLGIQFAAGAANAIACVSFNFIEADPERVETLVELSGVLARVQNGLYYVTLFPFGFFLVRANRNARATSGGPLDFTPASMVWWFAVPLLNLVRPYQAVRAVWEHSAPSSADSRSKGGILELWWAFWIVTLLVSRFSDLVTKDAKPEIGNLASALSNALAAGLAGVALVMIRALDVRQRRGVAELQRG